MQPDFSEHTVERYALLAGLYSMRAWPLPELFDYIEQGSPRAVELGAITIGECLISDARSLLEAEVVRELAMPASGESFDTLALYVLLEVYPRAVRRGYLLERLGGPRWKLQASMQRLSARGVARMSGNTSGRRYAALLLDRKRSHDV